MSVKIVLKNSAVEDKRPTANQLANGELSLGYNQAGAYLCCKDTDGNIQQVGGIKVNDAAPSNPVKGTLWFKTDTSTLYVHDSDSWLKVAGGDGGGGSGSSDVTQLIAGDGVKVSPNTGKGDVTITFDFDSKKGLEISSGKAAVKLGKNLSFDADGKIDAADPADPGVTKLTAGTGITLDPSDGTGEVKITATGGGGSVGNLQDVTDNGNTTTNNIQTGEITSGSINVGALNSSSDTASGSVLFETGSIYTQLAGSGELFRGYQKDNKVFAVTNDGGITADGDITTAGQVYSGGNAFNGQNDGSRLSAGGAVYASAASSATLWGGYTTGSNQFTSRISADGSISAAGNIKAEGYLEVGDYSNTYGMYVNDNCQMYVNGGATKGYRLFNNADGGNETFSVLGDGSVTLKSVEFPDGTVQSTAASAGSSGVNKIIAGDNITIDPTGGTGDVTINATGGGGGGVGNLQQVCDNGSTTTTGITADGQINCGADANNAANSGATLKPNGTVVASRTTANVVFAGYTTGTNDATFKVTSDGEITAAGQIESKANGFRFPDGTVQTTAATGGGGGGGGTTINYSGASAWVTVSSDGTVQEALNASASKTTTGIYKVTFTTAMPNADYAVNVSVDGTGPGYGEIKVGDKTANGFDVYTYSSSTSTDTPFSAVVFATNALPPKGGTGTDAWGSVQADGTIDASFNIDSITRASPGRYEVVFTTPMPTANYAVTGAITVDTTDESSQRFFITEDKTVNGFKVITKNSGSYNDYAFNFTVNATNAQLPDTITQEQIEAAINNPGVSAWGNVTKDGALVSGLNIASVTKDGTGVYDVVFATAMPDANYVVVGSFQQDSGSILSFQSKSATGFRAQTINPSGTPIQDDWGFTVFATNATPPKGGTGTDAWGKVQEDGTLDASFNIASVTKVSTGEYDVVFTTAMPTANYAVTLANELYTGFGVYRDVTTTGFRVSTKNRAGDSPSDSGFSFTVNATNAQLPDTVTQEQIEAAINNPGVSAWGSVAGGGSVNASLNISTVTKGSTGRFSVQFATPMPSADYSISGAVSDTEDSYGSFNTFDKTATGFEVLTLDLNGNLYDHPFDFSVFATNAAVLKGGTGTDAWGSVQSDGTIDASFNIDSVTRTGTGTYDVVFTTAMPTANFAVTCSVSQTTGAFAVCGSKTTTGFTVEVRPADNPGGREDKAFDFTVNATNATLPDTFTEEQIQGVIDAGPQGIAKAWVTFSGTSNTMLSSYNVDSITDNGKGEFTVNFTAPMANSNYAVIGASTNYTGDYTAACVAVDQRNSYTSGGGVDLKTASQCRITVAANTTRFDAPEFYVSFFSS